jgi:hypothetical protein
MLGVHVTPSRSSGVTIRRVGPQWPEWDLMFQPTFRKQLRLALRCFQLTQKIDLIERGIAAHSLFYQFLKHEWV